MQFTTATLHRFNTESYRFTDNIRVLSCDPEHGGTPGTRIELVQRTIDRVGPIAQVRVFSTTELDGDEDPLLLESYEVWSPTVNIYGSHVVLDGFMTGVGQGRDASLLFDTGENAFARVEWVLQ